MDVKNCLTTIRESTGSKRSENLNSLFMKSTDSQIKEQIISHDGIKVLVGCLSDESHKKIGSNASGILVNCLSEPEAIKQVGAIGIPVTIKFLDRSVKASDSKGIEYGSGVLMNVCSESSFHSEVQKGKGHKVLKRALKHSHHHSNIRAISNCLGAISHLCKEKSLREYFNKKKLLEGFVQMLSSPDVESRKTATIGLWNLGLADEETRLFLVKHKAAEGLLKILENESENDEVLRNSATALAILTSSEQVCDEIRKENLYERLCKLLSSPNDFIPQGVSISIWNIALTNDENRQELAKYNALASLIPLLQKLNQKSDWNSLEQVLSAVLACSTHEKLAESFKKDPKDGLKTLKTIIEGENGEIQVKTLTDNDQKKCILFAVISFIVMTYSDTNPGIMYESKMLFMVLIELLLSGCANSLFGNVASSIVKDLQNFKTKYQLPSESKLGMTVALPEDEEEDVAQVEVTQPNELTLLKDLVNLMGDEEFLEKLRPEERKELESVVDSSMNETKLDPVKELLTDVAADILERMKKEQELKDYVDNKKKELSDDLPPKEKQKLEEAYEKAKEKLDENPSLAEQEQIKKNFDKAIDPISENKKARQDLKDHAANAVKLAVESPTTKDNEKKQVLKAKEDHVDKFLEKKPDADKKDCEKQKERFENDVKKVVSPLQDKKELEEKVDELKNSLKDPNSKLSKNITPEEREKLQNKLKDLQKFIEDIAKKNPLQIKDKLKDVEKQVLPILEKCEKRDELKNKADEVEKKADQAANNLTDKEKENIEKAVKHANEVANNPKSSKDDLEKEKEKLEKVENEILGKADAKQDILDKIEKAIEQADAYSDKLKPDEREKILEAVQAMKDNLEKHPEYSKKELEEKKKELDKTIDPVLEKTTEKPLLTELLSGIKEKVFGDSDSSSSSSSSDSETDRDDLTKELDETANTITSDYDSDNEETQLTEEDIKNLQGQLDELNELFENPVLNEKMKQDEKEELEEAIRNIKDIIDGKETKEKEDVAKILEPIAERMKENEKLKDRVEDLEKEIEKLPEKEKKEIEKLLDETNSELESKPSREELESISKKLDEAVIPLLENAQARKDLKDHAEKILDEINKNPQSTEKDKETVKKSKDEHVDKFLDKNPDADKQECERQQEKFDKSIEPIMKPIHDSKDLTEKLEKVLDVLKENESLLTPEEKKVLEQVSDKKDESPEHVEKKLKDHEETVKPILEKCEEKKKLNEQADKIQERLQDPKDNVNNHLIPDDKEKLQKSVDHAKHAVNTPDITKDELKKESKKLKDDTDDILEKADLRGELVDKVDAKHDNLSPEQQKAIHDKCQEIRDALDKNPDMEKKELEEKLKELEDLIKPCKTSKISSFLEDIKKVIADSDSSSSSSSSSSDSEQSIDSLVETLDETLKNTHISEPIPEETQPVSDELLNKPEEISTIDSSSIDQEDADADADDDVCVVTLKLCKKTGQLKPHIVWKNENVKFTPEMLQQLTAQLLAGPPKK